MASTRRPASRWLALHATAALGGLLAVRGSVGGIDADCAAGVECQRSTALDDVSMLQTQRKLGSLQIEDICERDLKTSCKLRDCDQSRGPAECVKNNHEKTCMCVPGFCLNEEGKCVTLAKTMQPLTLTCNSANCTFPPSQQNAKLGMASSGGGGRALSFLVGVLRGLKELGWDESAVFLNVVSGSSWATAPYIFSDRTDTQLLGESTTPEELSLEFLGKPGSEIGVCQSKSTLWALARAMFEFTPASEIWTSIISSTFLEPFGISNRGAYMAASEEDVKRIKDANPSLRNAKFVTPRPGKPSIDIQATLMAPEGFEGSPQSAVVLEIAPDYVGSPFYPNGSTVTYTEIDWSSTIETRIVGGGFVETFAFGSKKHTEADAASGESTTTIVPPEIPFTLGDAIGASSWALGAEFVQRIVLNKFDPLVEYWPVSSKNTLGVNDSTSYQLGDGGNIDNSGVLALLQRKIPNILWIANNYQVLSRTYPWDHFCQCGPACIDEFDPFAAQLADEFMDKFGYGPEVPPEDTFVQNTQVFEKTEIIPVACEIWASVSSGRPAVVMRELNVLKNSWWGIDGGFKSHITLIYLESSTDFNAQLPQETQAQISLGESGKFPGFPIYRTMFQNPPEPTTYTLEQVNLLSAYGQWVITESAAKLRSILPILGTHQGAAASRKLQGGGEAA